MAGSAARDTVGVIALGFVHIVVLSTSWDFKAAIFYGLLSMAVEYMWWSSLKPR